MNILFYTVSDVSPQKGGTERITETLCQYFSEQNDIKCFLTYTNELVPNIQPSNCFVKRLRISENTDKCILSHFINNNNINIIVIQGSYTIISLFRQSIQLSNKSVKLLFVHHFNPGAETLFNNYDRKRVSFKEAHSFPKKIRNLLSIIKLPYTIWYYNRFVRKYYKIAYKDADHVILLSKNFITDWKSFAKINDDSKFIIIPNALSFSSFFLPKDLPKKKKNVLLVARFSENQKRIKLALKIWKEVHKYRDVEDWNFIIVGDGIYKNEYLNMVRKENIPNVYFEGLQKDTEKYYRQSSIFMMTSAFEGWGLTLTEAQQMGCVPIAFKSYKSLTDIITDNYNGIIIEECNIDKYIHYLHKMMINDKYRESMAINSIESAKRFSKTRIGNMWINEFKKWNNN